MDASITQSFTAHIPRRREFPHRVLMFLLITGMMLSGWVSISLPGRGVPGLGGGMDVVALAKLAVRTGGIVLLAWAVLPLLRGDSSVDRWSSRFRHAAPACFAAVAFLAWAFFSVAWSPLRSVTVGQSLGLASMMGVTFLIAIFVDSPGSRVRVLHWMHRMLWGFSLAMVVLHALAPDASGLMRDYTQEGALGVVHPTAAGANASLGLVLSVWLLLKGIGPSSSAAIQWSYFPSALVHTLLLVWSQSRTALAMAILCVAITLLWQLSMPAKGRWLCGIAAIIVAGLLLDPGFQSSQSSIDAVVQFVSRGQTASQLKAVSGRAEMWNAVWQQFQTAMVTGHGYFVTSATGKLDVWHEANNYTAHNIHLQILVSTGIIGTTLLVVAAIQILRAIWPSPTNPMRSLAALLALWYAGWTLTCVSFMGPIRTESVLFFGVLGLLWSARLDDPGSAKGLV